MKFRWINKLVFILFLISCTEEKVFDEQYYSKNLETWKEYLIELGLNKTDLKNQIVIVVNSTICSPCENELRFWDDVHLDLKSSLHLIVVEKYPSVYQSFLSRLNLNIPAYQDSNAIIFGKDLIPSTPIKIYFNETSEIDMVYPVGNNGNLNRFLDRIM